MKKKLLLGISVTLMLALTSCEFAIHLFEGASDPYTYKTEPPSTSEPGETTNSEIPSTSTVTDSTE